MKSTSSWVFDDDESCFHSWLIVNISVFLILMNSWMFCHSLLRYIFLSTWYYFVYIKSFEHIYMSDLLDILNLIFYFLDCTIYHSSFENRFKSITFFSLFKEWRFCVIRSKQFSFLTILFWLQLRVIHMKEEKRW